MGKEQTGGIPASPAFQIFSEPQVHGKCGEPADAADLAAGEGLAGAKAAAYGAPVAVPDYEDLGALPSGYGLPSLYLVARDPEWLFCYWDIRWDDYPPSLMQGGRIFLKLHAAATQGEVYQAEVTPEARNWYIPAPKTDAGQPFGGAQGGTFYGELGYADLQGQWRRIIRSNTASVPASSLSAQTGELFATVPYHLAFQTLCDLVASPDAASRHEAPLETLARMQGEGRRLAFLLAQAPEWTDEQRRLLAALLGQNPADWRGLSVGEINARLREQLARQLSSETALLARLSAASLSGDLAEALSSAGANSASSISASNIIESVSSAASSPGGASSSAGLSSTAFSSAAFSSQGAVLFSGLFGGIGLSSWLASWQKVIESGAAGGGASWLASWLGGAEVSAFASWLASWPGATSGLSGGGSSGELLQNKAALGVLSSWLASWPGVGASELHLSSWLASWPGAEIHASGSALGSWLSSWPGAAESGFWSSWLSSWCLAAGSSGAFLSSWQAAWQSLGGSSGNSFFSGNLGGASSTSGASSGSFPFWSSWLSSWSQAAGTSEIGLSSWETTRAIGGESSPGGLSSLGGASSGSPFWSSWLSSWSSGVGPGGLSSGALGGSSPGGSSSWASAAGTPKGGHPCSWQSRPEASPLAAPAGLPRDLPLALNAEVVFYGGTHPAARLWIDDRPVPLHPDGTFRYHVAFPGEQGLTAAAPREIAIVVESPNGLERRHATLRLLPGAAIASPQPVNLGQWIG